MSEASPYMIHRIDKYTGAELDRHIVLYFPLSSCLKLPIGSINQTEAFWT